MLLADALRERADLKTRLAGLEERILRNLQIQEGEPPAEEPNRLLAEFEEVSAALEALVVRINRTNLTVPVEGFGSMTEAIARRDSLTERARLFRTAAKTASARPARAARTEIKILAAVNVRETQAKADDLARERRELDGLIQRANWNHPLVD